MFKSKKILLIWTIILGWSVMAVAMDGGKAAPGSRTRGIPKRDCPDDVVEPDTTEEVPVLDAHDVALGCAWLEKLKKEKAAKKARDAAWSAANPEKVKAAKKAYRDTHKEKINAYDKVYKEYHRAKINAAQKAYRARKQEETNAARRARYAQQKAEKAALEALAGAGAPKIADV